MQIWYIALNRRQIFILLVQHGQHNTSDHFVFYLVTLTLQSTLCLNIQKHCHVRENRELETEVRAFEYAPYMTKQ